MWYQPDEAGENRKINADGKGWYAYYNHGLLLLKAFDDLPSPSGVSQEGAAAPGEAEIQVYNKCKHASYSFISFNINRRKTEKADEE